jgi:hypothetical protein
MSNAFRVLARLLVACVVTSAAHRNELQAQESTVNARLAAVEAVMDYRLSFLNDSSRYDVCALSRALGAAPQTVGLNSAFLALLDITTQCTDPGHMKTSSAPVGVDSIRLTKEEGSVRLLIHHGEYSHVERFTLKRIGDLWAVTGACLTGGSYADLRMPRDTLNRRQPDGGNAKNSSSTGAGEQRP